VGAAISKADKRIKAKYIWPYQMHARSDLRVRWRITGRIPRVWSGTQILTYSAPILALLMQMTSADRHRAHGGRRLLRDATVADDVSADAATAIAGNRPSQCASTAREQEHVWEPRAPGSSSRWTVASTRRSVAAYDFTTRYPRTILRRSHFCSPTPYRPSEVIAWGIAPPSLHTNSTRCAWSCTTCHRSCVHHGSGPGRHSRTHFAHESYIDELPRKVGADPIEFVSAT